ncbi:MAG: nucleotidyltransferase domain-containing protein [Alphaproteobacteria bacterium]|nr:nucleotidyltransferase domain-containing protein [Alphaproteobacteria bacterium]MDE2110375.1 nucleotidyltransferase domain-containing protein [Alphaproteobacteria bacterium]MDE2496045.1 nucleotidyltransferase domain-containing protein [Alphaproteobacteria bacterium]
MHKETGNGVINRTIGDNPVLTRFRSALRKVYGDRLERTVLFGSRARGEARTDSDYDIAVFLRDMPDRAAEMDRLADLATDILYETGECIHALPYQAGAWRERTPIMHEIRADGVEL